MIYIIALISILLGAFAQFFLKVAVSGLPGKMLTMGKIPSLLSSPQLWLGCVAYGLSLLFWLYVLSKMELSKAYPMVSLGYVFSMIIAYVWLNESINTMKIAGIILIISGVICIARG